MASDALRAAREKKALQPSLDTLFKAAFMHGVVYGHGPFNSDIAIAVFLHMEDTTPVYGGSSDTSARELSRLTIRERDLGADVARAKQRSVVTDAVEIGEKAEDLRSEELRFYRSITRKSLFERFMGVRSSGSASRRKR